jgi:rSAM/selenodomain-associated transferase 1
MASSAAIGIMCKAPRSGRVKTRLATMIGAEEAATLSACFLRDVAAAIERVPTSVRYKGYGVYAPAGAEAELRSILPNSFGLLLQADADFGLVLFGAVRDLLAWGHDCVVLVNSDSPTLPPLLLVDAVEALRRRGDRMVLGPAIDGGYYLIGLKAPHRHLFMNIPWGTAAVTRASLERAAEIDLEVSLLPEWYDIDDVQTFEMLQDELACRPVEVTRNGLARADAAATRAYLAAHSVAVK